jgi:transaldolase
VTNTISSSPTLFADTSDISEIENLLKLGIFQGITTNPLIVAKEAGNANLSSYYQQITKAFPDLPVSIQLLKGTFPTLFKQAQDYAAIAPNVVIKIPMYADGQGLTLIKNLSEEGIKVNVTALMKSEQSLLSLLAGRTIKTNGPSFVSFFFNRIKDSAGNPQKEIDKTRNLIEKYSFHTQIIAGSIRKGQDVYDAIYAGAHIVTVPPNIIWEMTTHPKTEEFINQSQDAWEELTKNSKKK